MVGSTGWLTVVELIGVDVHGITRCSGGAIPQLFQCLPTDRQRVFLTTTLTSTRTGVNYVRTACVIAVSKSRDIFEPLIHQVRHRKARQDCPSHKGPHSTCLQMHHWLPPLSSC